MPQHRSKGIRLDAHGTEIPCLAFLTNAGDREGFGMTRLRELFFASSGKRQSITSERNQEGVDSGGKDEWNWGLKGKSLEGSEGFLDDSGFPVGPLWAQRLHHTLYTLAVCQPTLDLCFAFPLSPHSFSFSLCPRCLQGRRLQYSPAALFPPVSVVRAGQNCVGSPQWPLFRWEKWVRETLS